MTAAVDQQGATQRQPNGGNTLVGVGGDERPELSINNISAADVQLPVASTSPNPTSKKERRRLRGEKRSKKRHQRYSKNNGDEVEDDQHSSFVFSSDSDQGDFDCVSEETARRTSVWSGTKQRSKASSKASKKTRRRVTRHTSPVVAVERAVQFITEQHRPTSDIHRPETSTHSVCERSAGPPCTLGLVDQSNASSAALVYGGGCSTSRCQRDHQCVFETWRRPLPRLSPVWVRREVVLAAAADQCKQRGGDCTNAKNNLVAELPSTTHVIVVDEQDGRATCGCNQLPSTLADVNCLSPRSPDFPPADGTTNLRGGPTAVDTMTARPKGRGQRRASGTHRPVSYTHLTLPTNREV